MKKNYRHGIKVLYVFDGTKKLRNELLQVHGGKKSSKLYSTSFNDTQIIYRTEKSVFGVLHFIDRYLVNTPTAKPQVIFDSIDTPLKVCAFIEKTTSSISLYFDFPLLVILKNVTTLDLARS